MSKGFEDLQVWQKAQALFVSIYQISKTFPKEDLFGITSQIRRSALSIPSNLAEGSAKRSDKDFLRYIMIAHGSCAELKSQLMAAKEIGILKAEGSDKLVSEINDIGKMLKGLERSLRNAINPNKNN